MTLNAGDKLTIDFQPINGGSVSLRLYKPDVTDFTLGSASSVAYASTSSKAQFIWTVPQQGAWILKVYSDHGYQLATKVDGAGLTQPTTGTSIATAERLPIGTTFVAGVNRDEFWLVTLKAGDKLTIDFEQINGGSVSLRLYKPDVTDFTLGNASSVAYGSTSSKAQFIWTVPQQGAWILKVYSDHGYQLAAKIARANLTQVSTGITIATAKRINLNATFVAGVNRDEFWRVTLNVGDKLTIDFQPINGGSVSVRLYKPNITDFTLGSASSVAYGSTSSRTKFIWTATARGSWNLKIASDHGYKLKATVKKHK